jgi:hypothetical protein
MTQELIARLRNDHIAVAESLGNEAAEALETLTAEVSRQKICIRAMTEEIQTLVREKVDAQEKIRTYQQGAYK